jgi:hypothetical protein
MRYIGVDLHKRLVVVCVVEVQDGKRVVVGRGRWPNQDTAGMKGFLRAQVPFQLVVESTSCYEWFVELAEPLADRVVLAHHRQAAGEHRELDRIEQEAWAGSERSQKPLQAAQVSGQGRCPALVVLV